MSLSWIPNAISFLRIVLIVPILALIIADQYAAAILLFAIAGFSDGLDGYLAVRYNWQSRLGALLDPTADKLLVAGLFITLAYMQQIPLWLAAIVIGRDLVIVAGAMAYHVLIEPVKGEPTRISKLNTSLQLLFLLFVLCRAAFEWPDRISILVLGSAMMVTVVISGVDYVVQWSGRAMKETDE